MRDNITSGNDSWNGDFCFFACDYKWLLLKNISSYTSIHPVSQPQYAEP